MRFAFHRPGRLHLVSHALPPHVLRRLSAMLRAPRHRPLDDQMLTRCEQVIRDVCTDFGADLREFNGEPDHVHLLVHYPPTIALSRLVNSLKGVSSRRLRAEFPDRINPANTRGHLWSPSYLAASCGGPPLEIIKEYIREQQTPG